MYPALSLVVLYAIATNRAARGLDCFKCVSLDRENPACEDPFHNNYTADLLESPCMSSRKNRNGLFPATACIKLNGVYEETGQTMVVRSCALDSGTLTVDTEIVRMSHCGGFYFEDRYVRGCLQSCFEDACNAASRPPSGHPLLLLMPPFLVGGAVLALAR
uniref:Putative secreted protein n=1 Tax=Amblyomma triste TaxID=251400 RepID=A0A023G553_AMBTT